jgi:hypothetical protein
MWKCELIDFCGLTLRDANCVNRNAQSWRITKHDTSQRVAMRGLSKERRLFETHKMCGEDKEVTLLLFLILTCDVTVC